MHRTLLAVLLAAATLMVGGQGHAGGPTSVLLTNPEAGRAAALYSSDPRYTELDALLQASSTAGTRERAPAGSTGINITWLAHDVSVWRTDSLVLDPTDGAWVSTEMPMEEPGASGSSRPAWHKIAAPGRVLALVSSLGLVGDAGPVAAAEPGASPAVAPPTRTETRWFTLGGWRWALPGALLGLLVGLGFRRRARDADTRQQLVDIPPERTTTPV